MGSRPVLCSPSTVILATASTCVATVTDRDTANNPSGDIAFTSNKEPAGAFSPAASCHLVPEGTDKATCQLTYTPATILGDHQITATYNPEDNRFAASSGEDTVTVSPVSPSKGATTTTLGCTPSSIVLGGSSACVATVSDTAAVGKAPSGQIKFASDGPGAFSGGGSCTLANAGAHRSSCQLAYSPSALGPGGDTHHLSATYSGDAGHLQSEGASQLTVSQLAVGAAPETKILKKPRRKTARRKARFTFSADQPGSSFQCRLDRRRFKPCRSPLKIRKLKKGRHVFRVKAISPQGIADPTPAVFRWRVSG